ncbi:hypothetical protein AVEN_132430-1 [Araneus ventricosus]|uniref:Uncharacterized protein n=1 Tax=Araneus ventricosus TaxID=182803 RepID=A0A4Y2II21_ARAVE|nr:hypothetical protein AVEN_132430-1 [Araneus ventricosus]
MLAVHLRRGEVAGDASVRPAGFDGSQLRPFRHQEFRRSEFPKFVRSAVNVSSQSLHSLPFHLGELFMGRSTQTQPLRVIPIPIGPISTRARESRPDVSTPVAFQHLWPENLNGAFGYSDWLGIHTSERTAPFLTGVFALTTGFGVEWGARECPAMHGED